MKCPIDNTNLVMSDRQGIEIDYCPECRGVWLDRGELDKIIERSEQSSSQSQSPAYYREMDNRDNRKKRKESWLSELFD
jgi:Zn-finger nucleic acid-binding protein